jgi:hypothetical protein
MPLIIADATRFVGRLHLLEQIGMSRTWKI